MIALHARRGGRCRRSNGAPCPGCPVDDLLSPGYLRGRLLFCPLCLLHFSLIEKKALPPPERRFPRMLVGFPLTLEYLHCGRGAGPGVPFVGRALPVVSYRAWGNPPVVIR